uniref:Uncharacterized protein n=1 Tax=Fagus sylvatica TaxID=28930 RepID=A0A2N9IF21_FAGSY
MRNLSQYGKSFANLGIGDSPPGLTPAGSSIPFFLLPFCSCQSSISVRRRNPSHIAPAIVAIGLRRREIKKDRWWWRSREYISIFLPGSFGAGTTTFLDGDERRLFELALSMGLGLDGKGVAVEGEWGVAVADEKG